jgi:MerR family transcriptional regulator, light-induced transcriptional regulator
VSELRDDYLVALRSGDRRAAFRVLDEALDAGRDLRLLYLEVVQPTMREIGRLWQDNQLSVGEEHLATSITEAAMSRLFERVFVWRDVRTPKLLAACAANERHQLGLRMLCDLLELEGWETTYLGAAVPIESLVGLVNRHQPDAVAISATISPHIPRVRDAISAIRNANLAKQPVIAVGGRVFLADPALAERVGADLTASDAAEAVRELNQRVRQPPQAA